MAEDSGELRDLFGDPWTPPRDPRGRKRHRRLAQVAEKVAVLRATGLTVEQIARRMGLSEPTLRKYYLRELDQGNDLARAVLDEAIWKKAMAGSVGAQRLMREILGKGAAAVPVTKPKTGALGKKALAVRDAATAHEGTAWGDLLQ
jgi:DNA-binding CsgD family transcriptional regulator